MSDALLEISQVDQTVRTGFWMSRKQILHGISFSVTQGSVCGFLGNNGAGKTTLIQLVVGNRRPTQGTVRILGHHATTLEARAMIGYLPERPYFYEHLTARRFLEHFGTLSGMDPERLKVRIPEVLARVRLSDAIDVELGKFSKGMLQRAGIAQAILHQPKFLVLDEPMSGLDPLGRKEMRELIMQLASEGHTVFFSSHVIPDVEAICDQVLVIEKGRVVNQGNIGKFLTQGSVQAEVAFSGTPTVEAVSQLQGVLNARRMPDGVRVLVEGQEAVSALLAQLLAAKAQILWVTPQRPSLEKLFDKGSADARD